jgi:hypothetical protein
MGKITNREGLWRNNISSESVLSGRFPFDTVGNSSVEAIGNELVSFTGL